MSKAQSKSQLRRFITQSDVTVIDKNTVEIAGIHYRRADLPPEGMVKQFVTPIDYGGPDDMGGWNICGPNEPSAVRIFVPEDTEE